ncbi:hypothetical protein ACHAXA_007693, partial [Cyclostephanos tholiformis]
SPHALLKASNVAADRVARRGAIADGRTLRGGGNRVKRSNDINDTAQKNIGDDAKRFTSVVLDYAGDEHDQPPMTRLADGEEKNTVHPTVHKLVTPLRAEKGVRPVAKEIQTYLQRTEGNHWKRRLRFDIPVEDSSMEDEMFFTTSYPNTNPHQQISEIPTTENPTTEHPTKSPSMDPTTELSHNPALFLSLSRPTKHPAYDSQRFGDEFDSATEMVGILSPSDNPSKSPISLPSARPTLPTSIPSFGDSTSPTPLMYCPPVYDYTKTDYAAGDTVEVDSYIFMCSSGLHEPYCNVADGSVLIGDEKNLWIESWVLVSACYRTETPSVSPTIEASEMPSIVKSEQPSIQQSGEPSISVQPSFMLSIVPSLVKSSKPSAEPSTNPSLITNNPTTAPAFPPSNSPTNPPTSILYCPPAYNQSKTDYGAGERVDVDFNVFECAGGKTQAESYRYEPYCNIADPSLLGLSELELWNVAWAYVGPCYRTETPSKSPSLSPTENPAEMPTTQPSWEPSHSGKPSIAPSYAISSSPSQNPSNQMTDAPTVLPSLHPTQNPTATPSVSPTLSLSPTKNPTGIPTTFPPSNSPTNPPTSILYCPPAYNQSKTDYGAGERVDVDFNVFECAENPAEMPTTQPSWEPSHSGKPSIAPSYAISSSPSQNPSNQMTDAPTVLPSLHPTQNPTATPSTPSKSPSLSPTENPAEMPTTQPSWEPSHSGKPSIAPSYAISSSPSQNPSNQMTDAPTVLPSLHPTQNPTATPSKILQKCQQNNHRWSHHIQESHPQPQAMQYHHRQVRIPLIR